MFNTFKQIFNPTNKDIRKRILYTLGVLLIFAIGTTIRVPGTNNITADLGFLEVFNAINGGALKEFSIFALGVMPYISASIFVSLLQMDIIPYFSDLAKEGPTGRQKLNQITRYAGIIMAFIQGLIMGIAFLGNNVGAIEHLKVALILTAGTAFLLWLGDQITAKGIGNGISIIIMAGIISTMPRMFIDAFNSIVQFTTTQSTFIGIISYIVFIILYLAIIIGIIYIQVAERRIPIQYANQSTHSTQSRQNYIPFKINSAGVMPVIFASAVISAPQLIASVMKNDSFTLFVNKYMSFSSPVGFSLYLILILLFGYLYTFLQLKPKELSDNLNKSGGYIPGIRPGKETEVYLKKILKRLILIGSVFLIVIAGMPILFSNITSLPTTVTIGGTSLLILVGVVLEIYNQLESSLVSRNYRRYK